MKHLKTKWKDMDRRPGYMRVDDDVQIICECGAIVVDRFGELHHVGPCKINDTPNKED